MVEMSKKLAHATDERRLEVLRQFWGSRLSGAWTEFKARRWGETAERQAVAAYVDMYGRADISQGVRDVQTPILIAACEQDAPPFRGAALEQSMLPYYKNAKIVSLQESGHYPMQEEPPLFATLLDRFLMDH
jgi:pimeloyl-ACP methyl ester carboxylesterase